MIWHKVQTQIAIDHYGIDKREVRAKAVRSVVDRILQENASSDEPERQKVALQAAKLIMADPFTGIMDKAAEPDWDNIKAIGNGEVTIDDVISVRPEKPATA